MSIPEIAIISDIWPVHVVLTLLAPGFGPFFCLSYQAFGHIRSLAEFHIAIGSIGLAQKFLPYTQTIEFGLPLEKGPVGSLHTSTRSKLKPEVGKANHRKILLYLVTFLSNPLRLPGNILCNLPLHVLLFPNFLFWAELQSEVINVIAI